MKIKKILATLCFSVMMVGAMATTAFAAEQLDATTYYYGNETVNSKEYTFSNQDVLSYSDDGVIIPITVKEAGILNIDVEAKTILKNVTFQLYSDEACTNSVSYSGNLNVGSISLNKTISLTTAGTYYLKAYSYNYDHKNQYANSFKVSAGLYTFSDKTIKNGQTISFMNGSQEYNFMYKATVTGTVTVDVPSKYSSYVTLLNSKKKEITDKQTVLEGRAATFTVKKNTVYYFHVKSNDYSGIGKISIREKAVKAKAATSKKKAVNIKAKKKVNGMVTIGSKKTNWYKFTLKKNKNVVINVSSKTAGDLKVTVFKKNGRNLGTFRTNTYRELKLKPMFGKLDKGTYYIKVSRYDAKSGGTYSIKWK